MSKVDDFKKLVADVTADAMLTAHEEAKLKGALRSFYSANSLVSRIFRRGPDRYSHSREAMLDWLKMEGKRPNLARLLEKGHSIATWYVTQDHTKIEGVVSLNSAKDLWESTIAKLEGRVAVKSKEQIEADRAQQQATAELWKTVETLLGRIQRLNDALPPDVRIAEVRMMTGQSNKEINATEALNLLRNGHSIFLQRRVTDGVEERSRVRISRGATHVEASAEIDPPKITFRNLGEPVSIPTVERLLSWAELEGTRFLDQFLSPEQGK